MQTKSTPVGIPSGTPVDPHLKWASELKEIDDLPTRTDEETDTACARQIELWRMIATTPAETLAGVMVKLGLMPKAWDEGSTPHEFELLALRSGIEDLRRMDARAADRP